MRDAGIKVVLTGEGADEMFAGYDLFREAKVRRFWARAAGVRRDGRALLERLYPYLERSPVAQRAMARQFFGRGLERCARARLRPRSALERHERPQAAVLAPTCASASAGVDARAALLAALPPDFGGGRRSRRTSILEIHTLLSGYLLSSQGDRMLMAHSVEGRFPFLDRRVAALAESLPPRYKLRVLDEKHVLKRAAADLVPAEILQRPKQPYRAPDALSFAGAGGPGVDRRAWRAPRAVADAGVLRSRAPSAQLLAKCLARAASGQFSNADNMARRRRAVDAAGPPSLHRASGRRRPLRRAARSSTGCRPRSAPSRRRRRCRPAAAATGD